MTVTPAQYSRQPLPKENIPDRLYSIIASQSVGRTATPCSLTLLVYNLPFIRPILRLSLM